VSFLNVAPQACCLWNMRRSEAVLLAVFAGHPISGQAQTTRVANSSKNKGDRGEREAVRVCVSLVPDLVVPDAMRMLGAGRREDIGDLKVFPDTAVQVKNCADVGAALRQAAVGAQRQARHGRMDFALGMAPIPRARAGSVRWLASCLFWPDDTLAHDEIARFGSPGEAVAHLRNEKLGVPRDRRVAIVERHGTDTIVVAPIEAWFAAYRKTTGRIAVAVAG